MTVLLLQNVCFVKGVKHCGLLDGLIAELHTGQLLSGLLLFSHG